MSRTIAERVMDALLESSNPMTVVQLMAAVGAHRNNVYAALNEGIGLGRVVRSVNRTGRFGRPFYLYSLAQPETAAARLHREAIAA